MLGNSEAMQAPILGLCLHEVSSLSAATRTAKQPCYASPIGISVACCIILSNPIKTLLYLNNSYYMRQYFANIGYSYNYLEYIAISIVIVLFFVTLI